REEVAVKVLEIAVDAGLELALVGQPHPDPAAHRGPPRVVDLEDLAVAPVLAEIPGAEEGLDPIGRAVIELGVEVPELHGGVVVDGAALVLDDDRKAVGVEEAAVDDDANLAPHVRETVVQLAAVAVAILRLQLDGPPGG